MKHQTKTVKGITFEYGENETQRYWEHIADENTYLLLQPFFITYLLGNYSTRFQRQLQVS